MKNTAKLLLLLGLLAAGCAKAPDPVEESLAAYILRGREGSFRLYSLEKIDSTTFRTEFEHRQNVLQRKMEEETVLYGSYTMQRLPKNAARHLEAPIPA